MIFQPTNRLTGKQMMSAGRRAREAVIVAHAVVDEGDFDSDGYEQKYGTRVECKTSFLLGYCIWTMGDWFMYEAVEAMA